MKTVKRDFVSYYKRKKENTYNIIIFLLNKVSSPTGIWNTNPPEPDGSCLFKGEFAYLGLKKNQDLKIRQDLKISLKNVNPP